MSGESSLSESNTVTKRKKSSQKQDPRPTKRQKTNFVKSTATQLILKREEKQQLGKEITTFKTCSETSSTLDNHEDDTKIAAFLLQLANTPTATVRSGKISEQIKVPHKLPASLSLPAQNYTNVVSLLPHRGQVIVNSPQQHPLPPIVLNNIQHNALDIDPTYVLNDVLSQLNKQPQPQLIHETNKPFTFKPTPLRVRANHTPLGSGTTYGGRNEPILPSLNMDVNPGRTSSSFLLSSLLNGESLSRSSDHYPNHNRDIPLFCLPDMRQNKKFVPSDSDTYLKLGKNVPSFSYPSITKTPTGFSTPFHVHSFPTQEKNTTTIDSVQRSHVIPGGVVVPSFSVSNIPTKSPRIPIN
eukprot:TRINITY_DN16990_c0_g1_i1.p1 TRINITY_DN16990_c0_g1~~TRINITY_DN16990_c0_g1_i1.p1  ORF type:complete len:369 (-),score=56.71 TRINITY_DN16990_c0_g1_i1:54-1118(-)